MSPLVITIYALSERDSSIATSVTRKPSALPSLLLPLVLLMFALYSSYWALDIYRLWAEYRSLFSLRHETMPGPDGPNTDSRLKDVAPTIVIGLDLGYSVTLYAQYILGLTLVSMRTITTSLRLRCQADCIG